MAVKKTLFALTVSVVLFEIPPIVALIVVVPGTRAVANPLLPSVFEMVAIIGLEDAHVTKAVRFRVEPSE